jgi:hypothetical protein
MIESYDVFDTFRVILLISTDFFSDFCRTIKYTTNFANEEITKPKSVVRWPP